MKKMWIEVYYPHNSPKGRMYRLHRTDVSRGDARDNLSPSLIALYEVEAASKDDAVCQIMLGVAKKLIGGPSHSDPLELLKVNLRNRRIKYVTDYACLQKYGKLHVIADSVWHEAIQEEAKKLNIKIDSMLPLVWPD